jgi:hypothetical protein
MRSRTWKVGLVGRLERHLDLQKVAQVLHAHPEIERPRAHPTMERHCNSIVDRWPSPAYAAKLERKAKRRQRTGYAATGR